MDKQFFNGIRVELESLGFKITAADLERPWGAFYYIDESQAQAFADHFLTAWMWRGCVLKANSVQKF